jgi:hypothetical protein
LTKITTWDWAPLNYSDILLGKLIFPAVPCSP